MRIAVDMQGAQASNRTRGIGQYTNSLVQTMAQVNDEHEIILVLSGQFPETIEPIREMFKGLIEKKNIRVWYAATPVEGVNTQNINLRKIGELTRNAFLAEIKPDMILITSLFEGLGDNALTSIENTGIPTTVVVYDLIPFIYPNLYMDNPSFKSWYHEKLQYLKKADLLLSISNSSRSEAIEYTNLSPDQVVNISADCGPQFEAKDISYTERDKLRKKYEIRSDFIMYTGGIDHRKNIERLITAYSLLSREIRESNQLVIVCKISEEESLLLLEFGKQKSLGEGDLVLTGFVPDKDLVDLYNLCKLFIFPSFHEGFGLPVLEAMRCGAPVISSKSSSLVEIVEMEDALFNPLSEDDIVKVLSNALTNQNFLKKLQEHGRVQEKKFSWKNSAKRALAEMDRIHQLNIQQIKKAETEKAGHPKLAYISPLPPLQTGIAYYSAELLPPLAAYYDIDVVVVQDAISDPWINNNCNIRSVDWFKNNAEVYDRILYHFGNSDFHEHMFDLLKSYPGVVVLHDFFLSGISHHMTVFGNNAPNSFSDELLLSHGHDALIDKYYAADISDVIWKYPSNFSVIQNSIGLIVHSEHSIELAQNWYGNELDNWNLIPLLRDPSVIKNRTEAREKIAFSEQDFIVCAFGVLGPTKLNDRLLTAWQNSSLSKNPNCHLVFVGKNQAGDYSEKLVKNIQESANSQNIHITGWTDADTFQFYLASADIGVQLRSLSRGETSASVLDCMNHGMATIVNANGSMQHLDPNGVWMLPDEFTDEQLVDALQTLQKDSKLRTSKGAKAREIIVKKHDPEKCAEQYKNVIEKYYSSYNNEASKIANTIKNTSVDKFNSMGLISPENALNLNFPTKPATRQLLVDISELEKHDANTGIQRVVKSILLDWLLFPPVGWRIEPVYATQNKTYRYARAFMSEFLGFWLDDIDDEFVKFSEGDVFFALDFQPHVQATHAGFYQALRERGVEVKFMVYDLLCLKLPNYFIPNASENFENWLHVVGSNDGAVCISKSVAEDFDMWLKEQNIACPQNFDLDWQHLGADFPSESALGKLNSDDFTLLDTFEQSTSFLMVGTLEPRKGHEQVLSAFELLWQEGHDFKLVIVGKQGWLVEELIEKINAHPELNHHLFWFSGTSDQYLAALYANCKCLIAASYGEGFGLPLIEASHHRMPILARDIPVFREIAGEYSSYFGCSTPHCLADAIKSWFEEYQEDKHIRSDNLLWLNWHECAQQLLTKIC